MKEFLSQRGIAYAEKYVDTDRAAAIEMVRRSGQQGVPVTVIGDEVVVGFDRARLERIVAQWKASAAQQPQRKSLGALVKDASDLALRGAMAMQGAYVGGVKPGSPAEGAGLRVGDVIVAVDDHVIRSVDELAQALKAAASITPKLTVARGTVRRDVLVRL